MTEGDSAKVNEREVESGRQRETKREKERQRELH